MTLYFSHIFFVSFVFVLPFLVFFVSPSPQCHARRPALDPAPLLSPRILTKNRIVPVPFAQGTARQGHSLRDRIIPSRSVSRYFRDISRYILLYLFQVQGARGGGTSTPLSLAPISAYFRSSTLILAPPGPDSRECHPWIPSGIRPSKGPRPVP